MARTNRQIQLAARPKGFPKDSDFKLAEEPLPEVKEGQFLGQLVWLSVDPYMRGRMNDSYTYVGPFEIGKVMGGGSVGRVVESKHPKWKEGDWFVGDLGWQEYVVSDGSGLMKIDPNLAPPQTALYVLGMPGMTAYFGLLDICDPKPGETVFVSGAAGAVGSVVGQIAKIKGCRVVGTAGSDEKIDYIVNECGFDAGFNYKTEKDYVKKVAELCPKGVNCYFDNVGGEITDAILLNLAQHARISICGQISMYNAEQLPTGPRLLHMLIVRMAKMQGFVISQYYDRYGEALPQMAQWLREGKIKYRETIAEGLENTPKAFMDMLRGGNIGKELVKIADV